MLWLSLCLPHLPLEVIARALPDPEPPLVVHETQGARRLVIARNRAAAAAGIVPGMRLSTAQSLAAGLRPHARQPQAETAALDGLAQWAGQFTTWVGLADGEGLLLEIAGSLRLFGGIAPIRQAVTDGLGRLGYRSRTAVATNPEAAWLLARNGLEPVLTERDHLREYLDALPVQALRDPGAEAVLTALGIRRLGECRRLPRAGLARRLGPGLLARLDRLYGLTQSPPRKFTAKARYRGCLELPGAIEQVDALQFPLRRLLQEQEGFLRGRGEGVLRLELALQGECGEPARIRLGLAAPTRDAQRLLELFRERLAREILPGPVEALELEALESAPFQECSQALFEDETARAADIGGLLERLRARLGEAAVQAVSECADHRPERAWQPALPGRTCQLAHALHRPFWLLPHPRRLAQRAGGPWLDGPLQLLDGPERIESGWWDGADMRRDYYIALTAAHTRVWLFREPGPPPDWYLHGVFA
ncbi:MAG TPA: DNA polymerase Y family protein [Thioalkalivibrio sp.]|nr:DNA polymerase Y family protein [Thioalkalivibrio sp.]